MAPISSEEYHYEDHTFVADLSFPLGTIPLFRPWVVVRHLTGVGAFRQMEGPSFISRGEFLYTNYREIIQELTSRNPEAWPEATTSFTDKPIPSKFYTEPPFTSSATVNPLALTNTVRSPASGFYEDIQSPELPAFGMEQAIPRLWVPMVDCQMVVAGISADYYLGERYSNAIM